MFDIRSKKSLIVKRREERWSEDVVKVKKGKHLVREEVNLEHSLNLIVSRMLQILSYGKYMLVVNRVCPVQRRQEPFANPE